MELLDFSTNSFEILYCKINRLKNHEHFVVDDLSPRRGAAPITNKKVLWILFDNSCFNCYYIHFLIPSKIPNDLKNMELSIDEILISFNFLIEFYNFIYLCFSLNWVEMSPYRFAYRYGCIIIICYGHSFRG